MITDDLSTIKNTILKDILDDMLIAERPHIDPHIDTANGYIRMNYNDLTDTYSQLYSPEILKKYFQQIEENKKKTAKIRANFLVIGNESYNLNSLSKFEIKSDHIVITIGAFTYPLCEKDIENYNDIPELIYTYFEHKQGKQI